MSTPKVVEGPFSAGERILLIDAKERRHMTRLAAGASFHTHAGIVSHDDIIDGDEGLSVVTSTGRRLVVVRPTFADIIVKMPRGAQVIYPKDLGAIMLEADIGPGMRVLEAGVGSGALSMAMFRGGAQVVGYEVRPDFANHARANVESFIADPAYRVEERDIYEGIDEHGLDRIVLDLPEPWQVIAHAEKALRPGGIFFSYLPTINQVATLRAALRRSAFGLEETSELIRRTWHVEERSVRPDHRMVAHTGFLTTARLLAGRPESVGAGESADAGEADEGDGRLEDGASGTGEAE